MVIKTQLQNALVVQLRPNCSFSWQQTKYFIIAVTLTLIVFSLYWVILGAWLVLPFIGLEISAVAFFCHRVCSDTYHQELISFFQDNIAVEWGKDCPQRRWVFPRESSEFEIIRPSHSLSTHQIRLKSGQRSLPIGRKLNKDDIGVLIKLIKETSIPIRFTGKTLRHSIDGFNKR